MPQTVVLDANALLMPFELSVNIDLELRRLLGVFEVVIPGPIIGELKRSDSKYASAALQLSSKYRIENTQAHGDQAVIELAKKTSGYVVTNDRLLRSKLLKAGIPVISLRSGSHLVLEGD